MATIIGDAAVRILPDMRQFATRMRSQMRGATSGVTRDMRTAGTNLGRTLGEGFTRGADGRLRDARGRFVTAGQRGGDGYARGFTRSATSGLQSAVTNITNVTTVITNNVVNEGQRAGGRNGCQGGEDADVADGLDKPRRPDAGGDETGEIGGAHEADLDRFEAFRRAASRVFATGS